MDSAAKGYHSVGAVVQWLLFECGPRWPTRGEEVTRSTTNWQAEISKRRSSGAESRQCQKEVSSYDDDAILDTECPWRGFTSELEFWKGATTRRVKPRFAQIGKTSGTRQNS